MEPTTVRAPETTEYLSFRTERIAKQRARVWANLNDVEGDREVEVGEVFKVYTMTGGGAFITHWLRYDVTNDGHGNHVISSTRYYTNPEA